MKIFIPERARASDIGGGFSFTRNFINCIGGQVEFENKIEKCDIYFLPGPTLADKEEVECAKGMGKKIVLRVDNMPRNSRNRNTGSSRLLKFAEMADVIIYQSHWAKAFLMPFLKKDGEVILNGVDNKLFNPNGKEIMRQGNPQCLYVRSSRDETKRWEKAWYDFQILFFKNPKAHLWIVGKFNPENIEYNFDLFGGAEKRYHFWGVVDDRVQLAEIYRSADILFCPFANEACSNTVNEAMASGLKVLYENDGGAIPEQIRRGVITLEEMCNNYLSVFKKCLEKN